MTPPTAPTKRSLHSQSSQLLQAIDRSPLRAASCSKQSIAVLSEQPAAPNHRSPSSQSSQLLQTIDRSPLRAASCSRTVARRLRRAAGCSKQSIAVCSEQPAAPGRADMVFVAQLAAREQPLWFCDPSWLLVNNRCGFAPPAGCLLRVSGASSRPVATPRARRDRVARARPPTRLETGSRAADAAARRPQSR
jgi:hypothetical protein